jgi:outer membrane protein OmpA-like peptidoglycan-associated protein
MKYRLFLFPLVLVFAAFLAGCAGTPEATPEQPPEPAAQESEEPATETPAAEEQPAETASPEQSPATDTGETAPLNETESAITLRAGTGSFSPEHSDAQRFFIDGAANQPIASWSFVVTDANGTVVSEQSGAGAPPEVVEWDGSTADGTAPEGRYTTTLTVVYDDGSERSVTTNPFLVDMTIPRPSFRLSGVPFTPDGDGVRDELIITIDAEDASPITDWLFQIQTPEGRVLARFNDSSDVPRTARWNGRPGGGFVVSSGDEYRIVGGVRDEAGNEGRTETSFVVGAMTEQYRGRPRIVLPSIQFPANSARIEEASVEARQRFEEVIDRLARILSSTDQRVLIEGHANATRFRGAEPDPAEQRTELIPLSRARAEVVRNALVARGIGANRLEIDGVGAGDPVVDFSATDRVRNRRIEFYVIR